MFIFWGSGGDTNNLGEIGERECSVCEKATPFYVALQYSYCHFMFVFSWVSQRDYYAVCGHCHNGLLLERADAQKAFPNDHIPTIRKKGWVVGLGLVVLLLVAGFFGNASRQKGYSEYLDRPQLGDIYLANLKLIEDSGFESYTSAMYGPMLLAFIDGDVLLLVTGESAYSKKRGVSVPLLDAESFDWENPLILSREEMRAFFDKGVIYEIRREPNFKRMAEEWLYQEE